MTTRTGAALALGRELRKRGWVQVKHGQGTLKFRWPATGRVILIHTSATDLCLQQARKRALQIEGAT